jgi:hypothetical protein
LIWETGGAMKSLLTNEYGIAVDNWPKFLLGHTIYSVYTSLSTSISLTRSDFIKFRNDLVRDFASAILNSNYSVFQVGVMVVITITYYIIFYIF